MTRTRRIATAAPGPAGRAAAFATGLGFGLAAAPLTALIVARWFRWPTSDHVSFPSVTGRDTTARDSTGETLATASANDSARRSAARALIVVRGRTGRPVPSYVTVLVADRRTESH